MKTRTADWSDAGSPGWSWMVLEKRRKTIVVVDGLSN